jgi:hypothetical protein
VTDLGWASELPAGVISPIARDATQTALAERLEHLLSDGRTRRRLSEAAVEHARESSFAHVAEAYLDAMQLA